MEEIGVAHTTKISISVVSHGQAGLIDNLLRDIELNCRTESFEFILTLNLDETLPFALDAFSFPVKLIRNASPLGFAANHNQAFAHAKCPYFCVLNPDIRLLADPFPALLDCLKDPIVGVVAPLVVGEEGAIEDSARHFPTPLKILCKLFGGCKGSDYLIGNELLHPDWVGGMFMLFSRDVFARVGGFNQRYFLYYEDVDLCARLRLLDYEATLCPQAKVIHNAQRSSRRHINYFRWHLSSMLRFFSSSVFWRLQWRKWL